MNIEEVPSRIVAYGHYAVLQAQGGGGYHVTRSPGPSTLSFSNRRAAEALCKVLAWADHEKMKPNASLAGEALQELLDFPIYTLHLPGNNSVGAQIGPALLVGSIVCLWQGEVYATCKSPPPGWRRFDVNSPEADLTPLAIRAVLLTDGEECIPL